MKKEEKYIAPDVNVFDVEMQAVMCQSTGTSTEDFTEGIPYTW